jgi:hypothetical protein
MTLIMPEGGAKVEVDIYVDVRYLIGGREGPMGARATQTVVTGKSAHDDWGGGTFKVTAASNDHAPDVHGYVQYLVGNTYFTVEVTDPAVWNEVADLVTDDDDDN